MLSLLRSSFVWYSIAGFRLVSGKKKRCLGLLYRQYTMLERTSGDVAYDYLRKVDWKGKDSDWLFKGEGGNGWAGFRVKHED